MGFCCSLVNKFQLRIEFIDDLADVYRETSAGGRQYGTHTPMKDLRRRSEFQMTLLSSYLRKIRNDLR